MRKGLISMEDNEVYRAEESDTSIDTLDVKQQYYLFGKIRYIVSDGRCDRLRVVDVARDITNIHYKKIERLYGLNKKETDLIIKNMAPLQKVET